MRIQAIFFILCFFLIGCVTSNRNKGFNFDDMRVPITNSKDSITVLSQYKRLDSAFISNSGELLDSFFNEWRKSTEIIQDNIVSNDSYRQLITKILVTFYRPDTIGLINYKSMIYKMKVEKRFHGTDEEFIKEYNVYRFLGGLRYFVVQNSATYSIYPDAVFDRANFMSDNDRRLYEIKQDSIVGIDYKDSPIYDKILLYNDEYYKIFNEYIDAANRDILHNTIKEIGERQRKRINFVKEYIDLVPEHWGDGWHIMTFPYSYRININESQNKAHIEFRGSFNTGGEADLKLVEGKWAITNYNAFTWIE